MCAYANLMTAVSVCLFKWTINGAVPSARHSGIACDVMWLIFCQFDWRQWSVNNVWAWTEWTQLCSTATWSNRMCCSMDLLQQAFVVLFRFVFIAKMSHLEPTEWSDKLSFIKKQIFFTRGRPGWQAEEQRPARHCRRAGLGPWGERRETQLLLLWLLLLLTGRETLGLKVRRGRRTGAKVL